MVMPNKRTTSHTAKKIKNRVLAIAAAPAAMPVKPNIPAIIAITRKMNDHRNITFVLVSND